MKTSSTPYRGWVAARLLLSLWLLAGTVWPATSTPACSEPRAGRPSRRASNSAGPSLSLPVVRANGYQQLQVGVMARMGPLVVGSDNLGGLLGLSSATGANVYFGLALATRRHRRPDRDGDGVSNRYDKCPKEKGIWATQGCPAPRRPARRPRPGRLPPLRRPKLRPHLPKSPYPARRPYPPKRRMPLFLTPTR